MIMITEVVCGIVHMVLFTVHTIIDPDRSFLQTFPIDWATSNDELGFLKLKAMPKESYMNGVKIGIKDNIQ